jgi:hypothetical protein
VAIHAGLHPCPIISCPIIHWVIWLNPPRGDGETLCRKIVTSLICFVSGKISPNNIFSLLLPAEIDNPSFGYMPSRKFRPYPTGFDDVA